MKKLFLFLSLLLTTGLSCGCSSEEDDLSISENAEVTKELAWEIVQKKILNGKLDKVEVYVSKSTILPNSVIETCYTTEKTPGFASWMFYIDDNPYGNWSHSCRYAYVNIKGGKFEIHGNEWYPSNLDLEFEPLVIITNH